MIRTVIIKDSILTRLQYHTVQELLDDMMNFMSNGMIDDFKIKLKINDIALMKDIIQTISNCNRFSAGS